MAATVFSESFQEYQYLLESTSHPKNPHHLISTARLSALPEHQPNLHQLGEKFFLIIVSKAVTGREGLLSEMKTTNDWGGKHLLSNPEKISPKFTFSTISQPNSNTKKLWNSTHNYEGFVQKSTAFIVSISAQLKLPISPDTYSGDNQHIHASSFRSYLKEWLVLDGKTKESKRADENQINKHTLARKG